jgi:hypothetical protein
MTISSTDKKILIISDIHNNVDKLDKIIKAESADINLVLGDWFDSFEYDETHHYAKTAEYLMGYLSSPNNHTLFGNHDLHYLYYNSYLMCGGYEQRKQSAINQVFGENRLSICKKFDWFAWVDGYLCTHAGLFPDFIDPTAKDSSDINLFLIKERERANVKLISGDDHWFYAAGRARGGHWNKGGLVWLDFDREFAPIKGLNQIVGHTPRRDSKIAKYAKTENYCIDTHLNQWLTFTNDKIEVKSYKDL